MSGRWTVPLSTLRGLAEDPALTAYDLPTHPVPRFINGSVVRAPGP